MAFGLDFGTTNSVVARLHKGELNVLGIDTPPAEWAVLGFDQVMPTVVGVGDNGELQFGWAAKECPGSLAAVKRLFKDETYVDIEGVAFDVEEVAAMFFAHLRGSVFDTGLTMGEAVVTIPANSRGLARLRTRTAAGMAPLRVQALINEPTAAAMAYAFNSAREETLLVVDWGGGTLDVTVLEHVGRVFREKASKGILRLGGLDFDNALAEAISVEVGGADAWAKHDRHFFRLDVEKAKIILSSEESTQVPLPGSEQFEVSREMFSEIARPLIERVQEPIERCLADIGALPSDIDTVLLVGGTCKIPAIRDFISDLLETAPAEEIDPMTAIAEGAAVASAVLSKELEDMAFSVSTEHALGTEVVDRDRAGKISGTKFSEIIPRNHPIPAEKTRTYHAVEDHQRSVLSKVLEGDPELPVDHPDNVVLKEWDVKINPVPADESAIDVTYKYDRDGILHVSVVDKSNDQVVHDHVVDFAGMSDRRGLVETATRAQEAVESGFVEREGRDISGRSPELAELTPELRELIDSARTKVIPFVDDEEAEEMRTQADLIEAGNAGAVDRLRGLLDKYPYLL